MRNLFDVFKEKKSDKNEEEVTSKPRKVVHVEQPLRVFREDPI